MDASDRAQRIDRRGVSAAAQISRQRRDLDELEANNLIAACPVCRRDHEWTPVYAVLAVVPA